MLINAQEATREIREIERENNMVVASPNSCVTEEDPNNTQAGGCQIVALTGLGSEDSRQEAHSSGTNLFLTKPVKLGEVKRLLSGVEKKVGRSTSIVMPTPNLALLRNSKWSFSDTSSTTTRVSFKSANSDGRDSG